MNQKRTSAPSPRPAVIVEELRDSILSFLLNDESRNYAKEYSDRHPGDSSSLNGQQQAYDSLWIMSQPYRERIKWFFARIDTIEGPILANKNYKPAKERELALGVLHGARESLSRNRRQFELIHDLSVYSHSLHEDDATAIPKIKNYLREVINKYIASIREPQSQQLVDTFYYLGEELKQYLKPANKK